MPSTPPKDVAELDELIAEILSGPFGPYLRRRLAERGVQMVPMPGQPQFDWNPYYTEPERG